jgi:hypothetical protein
MNIAFDKSPVRMLATPAAVAFFSLTILCSAYAAIQLRMIATSGKEEACGRQGYYRVDANGKEWPVTIQYTMQPKNGTATTRVGSGIVSVHGQVKTVRLARVIYQSRAGFSGYDSFTYRRVTADPTDPDNGKEYTVAVTVR